MCNKKTSFGLFRKTAVLCVTIAITLPVSAQNAPQRDYLTVSNNIAKKKLEHPYLVFDNKSKQEILERTKKDPEYKQIMDLL
ncbi:MAG: hypothetical protein LBR18_08970, partial [Tannerella sp.]|nr:hypothetical protein [Tannerella sp.]